MEKSGQAFLQRLLATFGVEAGEYVQALSSGLIELEKAAPERRAALVETAFREAHSLKGAARAVGKREIEALCQAMESVLSALKHREIEISPALLDLLHAAVDCVQQLLADLEREPAAALGQAAAELGRRLAAAASGTRSEARGGEDKAAAKAEVFRETPPPPAQEKPAAAETIRVPVSRLDALLFQGEALLGAKLAARQRTAELGLAVEAFAAWQRERARLLPEIRKMQRSRQAGEGRERAAERRAEDGAEGGAEGAKIAGAEKAGSAGELGKIMACLTGEDSVARALGRRLQSLSQSAGHGERQLGGLVDGLLAELKEILMLPVATVVEVLPKMVRDIAREQGKEVDFAARGEELEIDRRILEKLRDPLVHLIRNSVDHGIEPPQTRLAAGKPRRGRIDLAASQIEGGRIEIRIADDGAGIDLARLRSVAGKLGLLPEAAGNGTEADKLLSLVFQSGVSTSSAITDISGRGLGLAIVREKVERLGGTVGVESQAGAGTVFRLRLPLTLATFRGVLVRAGGEEFVFPTLGLVQAGRFRPEDIRTLENRETLAIDGRAVALVRLAEILELGGGAPENAGPVPVVLAGEGEQRIAFRVDEVLGEQEVQVKSLGRQLARVRNIGGAALLGSGRVVPILYLPDLLQSARRPARPAAAPAPGAVKAPARTVLVAEDSITSRLLLKGILEAGGYRVATAVDGLEAYARLCTEPFDALVSDVDMPRLNGFELTARLRAERRFADLPVLLVTALASREDRERGAEAGANAYIVKGSFEQSDLLAALRRLL